MILPIAQKTTKKSMPELIEDMTPLMDAFVKECINMEEKLLIQLMNQVLKREPTIDDFKECTRITLPHFEPNDYIIAYKNINLGFVKHQYNGSSATVTFIPDAGAY